MTERKKDIEERRTHKELEEASKSQERRTKIVIAAIAAAILIAAMQIVWYINLSPTVVEEFDPAEELLSTTMLINNAITNYRENNDGEVPDSLEDLLGEYLPETETWEKTVWSYTYQKKTPNEYELAPPLAEDSDIPGISISDKGIVIFGIEYEAE
jgi:hypothetical protein